MVQYIFMQTWLLSFVNCREIIVSLFECLEEVLRTDHIHRALSVQETRSVSAYCMYPCSGTIALQPRAILIGIVTLCCHFGKCKAYLTELLFFKCL